MLRICTEQDFNTYFDFVYELALNQSKSGYPTYSDGIKTKEMFYDRSLKAFSRDTEEIILFEYEGKVEGWIHYYWIPEDNYLSTVSFNINSATEQALEEFINFVEEKFKGYELFLGYSMANKKAVNYLSTHGFECIEDDFNHTAYLEHYKYVSKADDIVRITKENYDLFQKLHNCLEGDMYWNSKRIYDDIEEWTIFVKLKDGETIGNVYYINADDGWFEIFGIDMKDGVLDKNTFRELLEVAINEAKHLGGKYMTYFCSKEELEIVKSIGFECVGEYVCYKKYLV